MFARVEYWLQLVSYGFGQLAIFKIAEYLAKLSVFVAVFIFGYRTIQQVIEAKKEAVRRTQEEIRKSYDILGGESQSHAPHTRMLALATLRDLMEQDDSTQTTEFRKTMDSLGYSGLNLSRTMLRNEYDLAGKNLASADLSYADLKGADLSEANLEGATLSEAHLEGADLSKTNLEGATLIEADLTTAVLRNATLDDAVLIGAILRHAKLSNATMQDATFSDIDTTNVNNPVARAADLSAANLTGARLVRADLSAVDLSKADLSSADLSNATLAGYELTSTVHIEPAKLDGTILTNTKLTGADLQGVDMSTTRGLTLKQWESANTDKHTTPPENLKEELSSRE